MPISSIALGGLNAAESQFNTAAAGIAGNSPGPAPADSLDLSSSAVSLLHAKDSYAASLMTIKVADDMTKQVIDLIA